MLASRFNTQLKFGQGLKTGVPDIVGSDESTTFHRLISQKMNIVKKSSILILGLNHAEARWIVGCVDYFC